MGKSTVVNRTVELMLQKNMHTNVINYGTVMMEEATRLHGVRTRDDMRKLSLEVQRKLQVYAASRISRIQDEFVIIDTHLFIGTKEGFWPGMPTDVLEALKPTHLVLVCATAEEIKGRRESDKTRHRDINNLDALQLEVEAARILLFASSLVCGCPALVVNNSEGKVDSAAGTIMNAVFGN